MAAGLMRETHLDASYCVGAVAVQYCALRQRQGMSLPARHHHFRGHPRLQQSIRVRELHPHQVCPAVRVQFRVDQADISRPLFPRQTGEMDHRAAGPAIMQMHRRSYGSGEIPCYPIQGNIYTLPPSAAGRSGSADTRPGQFLSSEGARDRLRHRFTLCFNCSLNRVISRIL